MGGHPCPGRGAPLQPRGGIGGGHPNPLMLGGSVREMRSWKILLPRLAAGERPSVEKGLADSYQSPAGARWHPQGDLRALLGVIRRGGRWRCSGGRRGPPGRAGASGDQPGQDDDGRRHPAGGGEDSARQQTGGRLLARSTRRIVFPTCVATQPNPSPTSAPRRPISSPRGGTGDLALGRSERFQDPDLTGALEGRHEHRVGDAKSRHDQRDKADGAQQWLQDEHALVHLIEDAERRRGLEIHGGNAVLHAADEVGRGGLDAHCLVAIGTARSGRGW